MTSQTLFKHTLRPAMLLAAVLLPVFPLPGHAETAPLQPSPVVEELSAAITKVAETIGPSVVSIRSTQKQKLADRGQVPPQFRNSPLEEFFSPFAPFQSPREGAIEQALGSGVIIDEQGHILTNNHVAPEGSEVTVVLSDKREIKAKVIGSDPKTDLAVIQINVPNLTPARIGDSDKLKAGEWVVAVGNPFNLPQTITAGIVSAKGRANVGIADYEDFIQTDAAINPGNSGGPLVNLRGEVVGINTAIFSRSGGYMGIGFAIPTNMARSVTESLISQGKVVRGFLGVLIQPLSEGLAESFGFKGTQGALVSEVNSNSPAAKAGIQRGDIVLRFKDKAITDPNQLKNLVGSAKPGESVELEIFRGGASKTVKVNIAELPTEAAAPESPAATQKLGLVVETLTPELAARFRLRTDSGVVVTWLDPTGLARQYGIRPGDIIVEVQGQPIATAEEFEAALAKVDLQKGARISISRGGNLFYVFIQER